MNIADISLFATVILYSLTAGGYFYKGKYGLAVAFVAYAIANLGFIWQGRQ